MEPCDHNWTVTSECPKCLRTALAARDAEIERLTTNRDTWQLKASNYAAFNLQLNTDAATKDHELAELRARCEELEKDKARMDWLEGEIEREADWYRTGRGPKPHSLFRQNQNITRACIDSAVAKAR